MICKANVEATLLWSFDCYATIVPSFQLVPLTSYGALVYTPNIKLKPSPTQRQNACRASVDFVRLPLGRRTHANRCVNT